MLKPTHDGPPVEAVLDPPSFLARFTCVSILMGIFAIWAKCTFVDEQIATARRFEMHSYRVPLAFTSGYLVSLPLLQYIVKKYLSKTIDVKMLLMESMVLYNVVQVLLNGWMVYRFIQAIVSNGHPLVGDIHTVDSGATYAVWVHYCDKYLEFIDTYFMVLRGKMDQVGILDGEIVVKSV
jgi:elongation of very long chain fatty acids protein 4